MKQGLLFEEEKKEEEFKEEPEFPQYQSPISNHPSNHPELVIEFVNQCKNRGEQFDYTHVDTNPHDKKGKEPYLVTRQYVGNTKETPSSMTYQASSYELFLTSELEEKMQRREQPFAKDVPYLRQIPIQNYRFFITPRARKSLETMFLMMNIEFDFDKFIKEYMMSENHATDELIRLCIEKHRIRVEIIKLNNYTYDSEDESRYGFLHHIKNAVKVKFGMEKEGVFKTNKKDVPVEFLQMTPNELYKLKGETIENLIELNEELIKVERQIEPNLPDRCYGVHNINDRDWN